MDDRTHQQGQPSAVSLLPLSGEPLPLDLINTTYIKGGVRGRLMDALTTPADLDDWLASHRERLGVGLELTGAADGAHLTEFRRLREAVRALTEARVAGREPDAGDVSVVNAAARFAVQWQELAPGAGFAARVRRMEGDPRWAALGEVAVRAVTLLAGPDAERVRACPAPGCVLYFLKGQAHREWCTAGCGNRVRVARHSRRAAGGDVPAEVGQS
ncbi:MULTISPECIES: ABATE domain-containing protein [unclassified Streptomyces]|uniref:CGNR zinc finger domain-containing protein n=1 Tax=unclassified Streptomyces TaxID=2593676 RepID=UPI00278C00FC|nr:MULTISPECIES: ABATE domain-containing protein [unclassified Streptomyces]